MTKNNIRHLKNLKIISVFILALVISTACLSNSEGNKDITVVFRFDDYSALSDTELEVAIIEAFREKGLSFTIGVIPFVCEDSFFKTSPQNTIPLDSLKAQILRDAALEGTVEIGMHGYSHQTIKEGNNNAEFLGMAYEEQLRRIKEGKELLEATTGIEVVTFIPPQPLRFKHA
ncbi:MAG: DUF2334 domain-containing protein [Bacteroidales bacterium]